MDLNAIYVRLLDDARQQYAAAAERMAYTRGYLDALMAFREAANTPPEGDADAPDAGPAAAVGGPDARD